MPATIYSYISILKACSEFPKLTIKTMLVPINDNFNKTIFFYELRSLVIQNNIAFEYFSEDNFFDFSPDVVFLPIPYESLLPKSILDMIDEIESKIAYIPYGLETGGGGFNASYQFNLPLHNKAWRIFARSESHRKMFSRYKQNGSSNVVVTGAPRLDLYRDIDKLDCEELLSNIAGRKAVIWAPHFTVSHDNAPIQWSSFTMLKEHILKIFKERIDTHYLIFRPHPFFWRQLLDRCHWTHEEIQELKEEFEKLENATIDINSNHMITFKASNALIADCGSFLIEYFNVNKPILYTSPPNGYGLNDDRENILKGVEVIDDDIVKSLNTFLDNLELGIDKNIETRAEALAQIFYTPKKQTVGEAIVQEIVQALEKGDTYLTPSYKYQDNEFSKLFWKNSQNHYLAPKDYYDKLEVILSDFLENLNLKLYSIIDIGCGDGRYTRLFAQYSQFVSGMDISQSFIDKAIKNTIKSNETNINFFVEDIYSVRNVARYSMVSCMGVLSNIIDEVAFNHVLSNICTMVAEKDGLLLLKESLSIKENLYLTSEYESGTYYAVYRNIEQYINCVKGHGFKLLNEIVLSDVDEIGRINKLFLFHKNS